MFRDTVSKILKEQQVEDNPVYHSIKRKLTKKLNPVHLKISNESSSHAGHAAMAGNTNPETHFNVTVVSKEFENMPLIQRHRLVNETLDEEF